jgi:hypothetical protein
VIAISGRTWARSWTICSAITALRSLVVVVSRSPV